MKTIQTALSALLALSTNEAGEVVVPTELRLFSAGSIRTSKGIFSFSDASGKSCLEAQERRKVDYPFDYGHAMTVPAWMTPDPAESQKAAGWFSLEVRANGELWAVGIKWTELGEKKLRAREFRYLSPWFEHTEDGEITELLNCALTNTPATYGAQPMVAASILDDSAAPQPSEPSNMEKKLLLAALSLHTDATDDQMVKRISALSALDGKLIDVTGAKTSDEALGVISAWKVGNAQAVEMGKKLEEQAKATALLSIDAVITQAEKDGKAVPAQREALRNMGLTSLDTLKGFLSASVKIVPSEKKEPATEGQSPSGLTNTQRKLAAQLSISEKDFAEHLAAKKSIPVVDLNEEDDA